MFSTIFEEPSAIFIKIEIVACKLFQFFEESKKFVEMVKDKILSRSQHMSYLLK